MVEEFKQGDEDETIDFSQVTEESVFASFVDEILAQNSSLKVSNSEE